MKQTRCYCVTTDMSMSLTITYEVMLSLLGLVLCVSSGYGLIMPMQKPDGSLDLSSLLNHIVLLEQTMENKASTADTAALTSKLDTALADLKQAQMDLKVTQTKLEVTENELSEIKSDLKSTQAEMTVLKTQSNFGQHPSGNVNHSAEVLSLKAEVLALKSQCSCNSTLTITNPQQSTDVTTLQTDVSNLKMEVQQIKTDQIASGSLNGSNGFAAGAYYHRYHDPKNMLCLPEHPIYGEFTSGNQGPLIYGTEYETSTYTGNHLHSLQDEDVPCVVCQSEGKRSAIMVPARNQCHPGWNLEYSGYLMGGSNTFAAADYICVDKDAEAIPGGHYDVKGQNLWLI